MNEASDVITTRVMCSVRAAQPCDCDAMARLAAQLGYECSGDDVRKRLSNMQDPTAYAVFVAELLGGEIAGWIGVYLFRSVEKETHAEISGLVIDEKNRSLGIGKILISAAEQWTRSLGYSAISVRSNIKRTRAHWFYMRNGYHHVKVQKEFQKLI